jgi:hypothetical protein
MRAGCECRGSRTEDSTCPPYREGISCWDFDWLGFYDRLPASEQEVWSASFEGCIDCTVFSLFDEEMKMNILLLKERFYHD